MNRPRLDRLFDDWAAKALCLGVAVGLFWFYTTNRLEERPLSVPLAVIESEGLVPAGQYPRTVRLVLRGESNAIYSVLEGDLVATLDLSGYTSAGLWRVPVRIEKKGSALGIDPLQIDVEPADVAVSMEPRVVKELAVVPSFRGYLESGYELTGFAIDPPRVEAAGPAGAMQAATEALTEPIDLSGRDADFSITIPLRSSDPLVRFVTAKDVVFSAGVSRALVWKTFEGLVPVPTGLVRGLSVAGVLPPVSVTVSGSRSELDAFSPPADVLAADLSGVDRAGVHTVAIVPRFPEGLEVESWSPMAVAVTVQGEATGPRSEVLP